MGERETPKAWRVVLIRVGSDVITRREGALNMHCMHKGRLTFTYG